MLCVIYGGVVCCVVLCYVECRAWILGLFFKNNFTENS